MPSDDYKVIIMADKTPVGQHRRQFNAPTIIDEVAIVIVGEEFNSRDITLHHRNGDVQQVSETHRSYDALQYPILFWQGGNGYHFNINMRLPTTNVDINKKVLQQLIISHPNAKHCHLHDVIMRWSPFDPEKPLHLQVGSYALVVLNREINLEPEFIERLWNNATFRSTVDGGTDKWFNYIKKHKLKLKTEFPNTVSGDFDSISPEKLKYCKDNNVYVENTPDQNYTDFQKTLKVISEQSPTKLDSIIVLEDNGGRLDQIFSNINTLGCLTTLMGTDDPPKSYLLGTKSLTWILTEGNHEIEIPEYLIKGSNNWCAILPFQPIKNKISTTGLKWNLDNHCIEFGGLISSSNTYSGESLVTIKTDAQILWSMAYSS